MAHQEAVERELQEMLKAGIVEPSDSPWASSVVTVPKKNSVLMRFCVDYWPLNKATKKDSYPFPRIDESLNLVAGCSWFSTLDLQSGYWQVLLSQNPNQNCLLYQQRTMAVQFLTLAFVTPLPPLRGLWKCGVY